MSDKSVLSDDDIKRIREECQFYFTRNTLAFGRAVADAAIAADREARAEPVAHVWLQPQDLPWMIESLKMARLLVKREPRNEEIEKVKHALEVELMNLPSTPPASPGAPSNAERADAVGNCPECGAWVRGDGSCIDLPAAPAQPGELRSFDDVFPTTSEVAAKTAQAYRNGRCHLANLKDAPPAAPVVPNDTTDAVSKALIKALQLGQNYWLQSDSETSYEWRRSKAAHDEFEKLMEQTLAMLAASPAPTCSRTAQHADTSAGHVSESANGEHVALEEERKRRRAWIAQAAIDSAMLASAPAPSQEPTP